MNATIYKGYPPECQDEAKWVRPGYHGITHKKDDHQRPANGTGRSIGPTVGHRTDLVGPLLRPALVKLVLRSREAPPTWGLRLIRAPGCDFVIESPLGPEAIWSASQTGACGRRKLSVVRR